MVATDAAGAGSIPPNTDAALCGLAGQRSVDHAAVRTGGGRTLAGALFETTVLTEIAKQATWSDRTVDLSHFRDRNGAEVDLVVEDRHTGELAGIEVKLSSTPTAHDAPHLALLRDALPGRFVVGLVVHTGEHTLPLGDRLWAVSVSALWRDDLPA